MAAGSQSQSEDRELSLSNRGDERANVHASPWILCPLPIKPGEAWRCRHPQKVTRGAMGEEGVSKRGQRRELPIGPTYSRLNKQDLRRAIASEARLPHSNQAAAVRTWPWNCGHESGKQDLTGLRLKRRGTTRRLASPPVRPTCPVVIDTVRLRQANHRSEHRLSNGQRKAVKLFPYTATRTHPA